MRMLRRTFLALCFASVALVAWYAQWYYQLRLEGSTLFIRPNRSPVWNPPDVPTYAQFRQTFEYLPEEAPPVSSIRRKLNLNWMALDLLLCLWLVTVVVGVIYLMSRKKRRDIVLQCALSIGIGLSIAAGSCIGLWLYVDSWGPPLPVTFGCLGLVFGFLRGILTFKRAEQQRPA